MPVKPDMKAATTAAKRSDARGPSAAACNRTTHQATSYILLVERLWAFLAWDLEIATCLLCDVLELGCVTVTCLTGLMPADTAKPQLQQAMCLLGLSSFVTYKHWQSLPQAH